ncbi:hypothetical protein GIB67_007812 [Kingdonia uniflora]|uniref:Glycosyltransferase n=1 Tax=Kingdonia uniflora TaxID=39325 RepID=A0A7J7N1V1_9MAGN|nr:hypothetical protein GIB67_007812 [Kingdonia uniflora]
MEKQEKPHVLVLPYPSQGHINPLGQFANRLVSKGLKATLVTTIFLSKTTQLVSGSVGLETISDGYDDGGFAKAESIEAYLDQIEVVGSRTLGKLIEKQASNGTPVKCLVYDAFFPWGLDLAKRYGIMGVPFFTQPWTVNNIYYHFYHGLLKVPVLDPMVSIPGLVPLRLEDLPGFISSPASYPAYLNMILSQFSNLEKADLVFVNTFEKLEVEVLSWMAKVFPISTIGPTLPSMYLDKRIEDDKNYGLNLYKPNNSACMNWLNTREPGSVVYVSFGSMAVLGDEQMEELAWGLRDSNSYFLWVVRSTEEEKLPCKFLEETSEKGLVVNWSPQLNVLAHPAVGCFVTHCGWNSVLEALSLGVPMVGLPQWSDQPTNAMLVEDIWGVGVRAEINEKGMVTRKEIELCIREITEGNRGKEMKRNAKKWRELAIEAVDDGGTSDNSINEFVLKLVYN